MSPLRIESYIDDMRKWVDVGEIKPGNPPGTISSNLPSGKRQVYVFLCSEDDSRSVIGKLPPGIDVEIGH